MHFRPSFIYIYIYILLKLCRLIISYQLDFKKKMSGKEGFFIKASMTILLDGINHEIVLLLNKRA